MFFLQSEQFSTKSYSALQFFLLFFTRFLSAKYYNINEKGKNHVITLTLTVRIFIILIRNAIYRKHIPDDFIPYDQKRSGEMQIKIKNRDVLLSHGDVDSKRIVLDVAEKLCNKVAIIRKGRIIDSGTMEEMTEGHSLEEVFLEVENEQ